MKSAEERKRLHGMGAKEIRETLNSAREELMSFRFRRASGQLTNSAAVKTLRRNIARGETILKETELKGSAK